MKIIHEIEFKSGSREELLPDYSVDFPCISSYVELNKHMGRQSPWHWHNEIELFVMEEGELEYRTPQGRISFPKGSGGFVNSNVLHMSKARDGVKTVISLLHLFDPVFISGQKGSSIDRKYVIPLTTASQIEIIGLYPENPAHERLLHMLRESFSLSEKEYGYELRLREALSEIWRGLLETAKPLFQEKEGNSRASEKIKAMMVYIYEHYTEKITVAEIAAAAYISERECFRAFHDYLKTTPVAYVLNYRIQKACYMLLENREPVTAVSQACGLGSSSYFGKVFREHMGCSPLEYRSMWQDNNINRRI